MLMMSYLRHRLECANDVISTSQGLECVNEIISTSQVRMC